MRTCVGCRRADVASALLRISRQADGTLGVGPGPGRGAWLCGSPATNDCLEAAVQRRSLDHALRTTVSGDEVVLLRAKLDDMSG